MRCTSHGWFSIDKWTVVYAFTARNGKPSPWASVSSERQAETSTAAFHLGLPPRATTAGGTLSHHMPRIRMSWSVSATRALALSHQPCTATTGLQTWAKVQRRGRDGKTTILGCFCRIIVSIYRVWKFGFYSDCHVSNTAPGALTRVAC